MSDVLTKEQRHLNMSHIHGKDTKPEEIVRKYLFASGYRYRKNDSRYPGKPDIVLPKYHTVIFVHGCFWYRHPGCRYATTPSTNREFWRKKFDQNVARDKKVQEQLKSDGWNVIKSSGNARFPEKPTAKAGCNASSARSERFKEKNE